MHQAAVRHDGRGRLVDQIAPGDRFHERLAQRRLVEITEPRGLDLFVPLFAPVSAVRHHARTAGHAQRTGDLDRADVQRFAEVADAVDHAGDLEHVADEHALDAGAELELQTERVEADAALHGHVGVQLRRDRPLVSRIVFAPRRGDLDDGGRSRSKLLDQRGGHARQFHQLFEVEQQGVAGVDSADHAPTLHVFAVPLDDAAHVFKNEVADGFVVVFIQLQPVGHMVVGERHQRPGHDGDAVLGQPLDPHVGRLPVDFAFLGLDVPPAERQVREVERFPHSPAMPFGGVERIDHASERPPVEAARLATASEEDVRVKKTQFLADEHASLESLLGDDGGLRRIVALLQRGNEQVSSPAQFGVELVHAGEIEQAPLLPLVVDPHESSAGEFEAEIVGLFTFEQPGAFDQDTADVLDRPEHDDAGRARCAFAAVDLVALQDDLAAQGDSVAADEVSAVQVGWLQTRAVAVNQKT